MTKMALGHYARIEKEAFFTFTYIIIIPYGVAESRNRFLDGTKNKTSTSKPFLCATDFFKDTQAEH